MHQRIQRIDHIVWRTHPDTFEACTTHLEAVLGVRMERDASSTIFHVSLDWDAGVEVLAPKDLDSETGRDLQNFGEGFHSLVFGVEDIDAAVARATSAGMTLVKVADAGHLDINRDLEVMKEAFFEEDIYGVPVRLGQIKPRDPGPALPDGLVKQVQRIDHVVWLVRPDNFDACVQQLHDVLGIHLVGDANPTLSIRFAIDWSAGIEVLTSTDPNGPYADLLAERGEGLLSLVFGVEDIDESINRAVNAGLTFEKIVDGSSLAAAKDMKVMKEAFFKEDLYGVTVRLGEIEPQ